MCPQPGSTRWRKWCVTHDIPEPAGTALSRIPDRGQGHLPLLRQDHRARRRQSVGDRRRDPRGDGPERLGQVDAAALPGRHLHAGERRGVVRRPAAGHAQRQQAHRTAANRLRLRLPVRPARARADRRRQHCAAAAAQQGQQEDRVRQGERVAAPAPAGRPGCTAHRRAVRRRGAASRARAGTGRAAQGPVRRRADRIAGHAHRRDGHGPTGQHRPRGGLDRRPGHSRRPRRRLRGPRGDGARRQGDQPCRGAGRRAGRGEPIMYRLGLRLTLRSGKEPFVRLLVTAVAVAIGVTIMLAVLADFHAFHVTNSRPSWESTTGQAVGKGYASDARSELWNYSNDIYRGQTIERLDIAALGPHSPVPPGISTLPAAGQYYASPALATLIRSAPANQLGDRFPGTLAGTIGQQALTGPSELVIYSGYTPANLAGLPATTVVDKIATAASRQIWSSYFRDAFAVGAIAFVFPILILVGTATRLAAARREERYAALRLVGATPRQISVISSVAAVVAALLGPVP